MAIAQDILTTPSSGYLYIDALLAAGPDWNFLTTNGSTFRTILYYSFSTDGPQYESSRLQGFNAAQQQAAKSVLAYVSQVTGITFAEVTSAAAADLHFASADIGNPALGGVCYADYSYTASTTGKLTSYTADAYIYLDVLQTSNLAPVAGSWWYQALLHEVGHALGLKHPFEVTDGATSTLASPYQDNTATTIMSYTHSSPTYYSQFSEYDLAALNFLYGTDGLRGEWGTGTAGLYLSGSTLDSNFNVPLGKAIITDSGGNDRIVYSGGREDYTIVPTRDKAWLYVRGADTDHLVSSSVEFFSFSNGAVATEVLLNPAGKFILGSDTDNLLSGTLGNDIIFGFGGNDIFTGMGGDDRIYGCSGQDTIYLATQLQDAHIVKEGEAVWTVSDRHWLTTLDSVERIEFSNAKVALDLAPDQSAGMAALVVSAVLGQAALSDWSFMGGVIDLFDSGLTLPQFCELLVKDDSFKAITGGTDTGLANVIYTNLFGTAPTSAPQNPYLNLLQEHGGSLSQADLLVFAAVSQENQDMIQLTGLPEAGLVYL